MNESLLNTLRDHPSMWLIVLFSVVAMAVAIERTIVLWRFLDYARALTDTAVRCLNRGAIDESRSACERSKSALADAFLVGFERKGRTKEENVRAAVQRERLRISRSLKSPLWMLATIGATAPFVGLFGTVRGIIGAFGNMREDVDNMVTKVAPDISMALYATAAGILVAVEAVIIFNFFNQRTAKVSTELKLLSDEFLEALEESADNTPLAGGAKEMADGARATA